MCFLPVRCHLPGPGPQRRAVCTYTYTGSWTTSPPTGTASILSCHHAPDTHTHIVLYDSLIQPHHTCLHLNSHSKKTNTHSCFNQPNAFYSFIYSFSFSNSFPLRLTWSLLQLSAADTVISSSLKRTSESLFRQTAEEVCTFLVSHNCKKHTAGNRLE